MRPPTHQTVWRRLFRNPVTLVIAGLVTASCGSSDPFTAEARIDPDPNVIKVSSAASPESEIIALIYIKALVANGFHAGGKLGIGQREGYLPALRSGEINLIPEYTGNLLQYLDKSTRATAADEIKAQLDQALTTVGLVAYAPAPASDTDSVTVTKHLAQTWGLHTIADLIPHVGEFKIAGNSEFQERVEGLAGLKQKYGLDIPPDHFVAINDSSGPATVKALRDGQVQAADLNTTTPALADGDLVVLDDPLTVFPPNNIVPVLGKQKDSPKLRQVLDAVSAQLTTQAVIELNRAVSGPGSQEPEDAASAWLKAHGLDKPLAALASTAEPTPPPHPRESN